jgi:hypothetical protein
VEITPLSPPEKNSRYFWVPPRMYVCVIALSYLKIYSIGGLRHNRGTENVVTRWILNLLNNKFIRIILKK